MTDFLSRRRAAWLARDHYWQPLRPQCGGQPLQLRTLSAAVESLERKEFSARVGRHGRMIALWVQVSGLGWGKGS